MGQGLLDLSPQAKCKQGVCHESCFLLIFPGTSHLAGPCGSRRPPAFVELINVSCTLLFLKYTFFCLQKYSRHYFPVRLGCAASKLYFVPGRNDMSLLKSPPSQFWGSRQKEAQVGELSLHGKGEGAKCPTLLPVLASSVIAVTRKRKSSIS